MALYMMTEIFNSIRKKQFVNNIDSLSNMLGKIGIH